MLSLQRFYVANAPSRYCSCLGYGFEVCSTWLYNAARSYA